MLPTLRSTPAAWLALLLVCACAPPVAGAIKPCGWYFGGSRDGVGWVTGVWTGSEVDSKNYVEWTWLPRQNGTLAGVLRVTPGGTEAPTGQQTIRLTVLREPPGGPIVLEDDGHTLRLVESGPERAVFADEQVKLSVRFVHDGSGLLVWTREEGGTKKEWRLYREV